MPTFKLGYLPVGVARLAASPQLLDGFLRTNGLFDTATLDPLAREVLIMTMATRNGCHVCVAMHSGRLTSLGADPGLIAALRESRPSSAGRLEAMRDFLDHGYTRQNALEVVLGIGAYTMSTLANRMTDAPLDEALRPFAWTEHAA